MKLYKSIFIIFLITFLAPASSFPEETGAPGDKSHLVTVKKVVTAGNYTYLNVVEQSNEMWIATMPSTLKVKVAEGDEVEYLGGITMKDFKSKGMDRTFDTILFVSRIRVLKKNMELMPDDDFHKQAVSRDVGTSSFEEPGPGEIRKPEEGITIGDLLAGKDTFSEKEVILTAKVMKVSKNILKKNWITVKDGTGTAPDDKVMILTTDSAEINDILTFKGTAKTDVNLGAGYRYDILIDEAEIIRK